jgi:hypothetical protein
MKLLNVCNFLYSLENRVLRIAFVPKRKEVTTTEEI